MVWKEFSHVSITVPITGYSIRSNLGTNFILVNQICLFLVIVGHMIFFPLIKLCEGNWAVPLDNEVKPQDADGKLPTSLLFGPQFIEEKLYQLCSLEVHAYIRSSKFSFCHISVEAESSATTTKFGEKPKSSYDERTIG